MGKKYWSGVKLRQGQLRRSDPEVLMNEHGFKDIEFTVLRHKKFWMDLWNMSL